jgi:hypothetical protein
MTYTDTQLQLALAKMLPEKIFIVETENDSRYYRSIEYFKWRDTNNSEYPDDWFEVRETEWLHVCWLVEDGLSDTDIIEYNLRLEDV